MTKCDMVGGVSKMPFCEWRSFCMIPKVTGLLPGIFRAGVICNARKKGPAGKLRRFFSR